MRRVRLLFPTLAALIAVASCTSCGGPVGGHNGTPSIGTSSIWTSSIWTSSIGTPSAGNALATCRDALPGKRVVSGTWTTVGDLRTWGYGGPVQHHPLGEAFPSAAPSDQAAWCWTKDGPDTYTAWGARASDGAKRALTVTGPTATTPSGPPRVP